MGHKVLIVDDNTDLRVILRRFLERNGFSVREAANGRRAMEQLKAERPDVMLLDIMMPEMGGLEALQAIRRDPEFADLPVIMVTAKQEDADVLAGYDHGADYYVTKPYTNEQLLHSIGVVLGKPNLLEEIKAGR